jgi:hypothetical protein
MRPPPAPRLLPRRGMEAFWKRGVSRCPARSGSPTTGAGVPSWIRASLGIWLCWRSWDAASAQRAPARDVDKREACSAVAAAGRGLRSHATTAGCGRGRCGRPVAAWLPLVGAVAAETRRRCDQIAGATGLELAFGTTDRDPRSLTAAMMPAPAPLARLPLSSRPQRIAVEAGSQIDLEIRRQFCSVLRESQRPKRPGQAR